MTARVQITATAEPSPAQLVAWRWLWRRLLAEEHSTPAGKADGGDDAVVRGSAQDGGIPSDTSS